MSTSGYVPGEHWGEIDEKDRAAEYAAYLDRAALQLREVRMASLRRLGLAPGVQFLDVGCGVGDLVIEGAEMVGTAGRAVGVDLSEGLLATARARAVERSSTAEFQVGNAHALPFDDAAFDAVRCGRVLMHVPDPASAVREMARVMRPGARCLLVEPDWETAVVDAEPSVGRLVLDEMRRSIANPTIGRQLPRLLRDAGLADPEIQHITIVFDSLESAESSWGLTDNAARAVETGIVTAGAAKQWLDECATRDGEGRFFAFSTAVSVLAHRE